MRGKITATRLNVRGRPSMDAVKLGVLTQNSMVTILEEVTNWYEIKFNSGIAFVHQSFVEPLKEPKPMNGRITASLLNVRSAPSLNSTVLGTLARSSTIRIISERDDDWLEIRFNGVPAFVFYEFVELLASSEQIKRGRVTATNLNVRMRPDTKASKAGSLPNRTEVEIHNQVGEWYEIRFNNNPAFIHSDYVEIGDTVADKASDTPTTEVPQSGIFEFLSQDPKLAQVELKPSNIVTAEGSAKRKKVINAWNNYGNLLKRLSDIKGIEVGTAIAVICVESSGRGFGKNSKMIIRFENHQFWKRWGKNNESTFRKFFKFREGKKKWLDHKFREKANGQWHSFHGNQSKEWQVLELARKLNEKAALDSISMGLPQMMGFNSSIIGYTNVQDMFKKFSSDIRFHLFGLFDFLDKRMIKALQEKDFEEFAKYYNGPGQAEKYGGWIEDHYEIFKESLA